MIDTPLTDAEVLKSRPPFYLVTADFARELEREIVKLKTEMDELESKLKDARWACEIYEQSALKWERIACDITRKAAKEQEQL